MKLTRKQKKNLTRILVTLPLLVSAWIVTAVLALPSPAEIAIFAVPYILCGYDVLWTAARNIVRGQIFDENFLMSIATLGAFFVSEYPEAVAVMLFYQLGELFQSIAVGSSRRAIAKLMDIRPDVARVLRGGEELELSPEEVAKDELILCLPGDRIPLDGVVVEGSSAVNTAALTGESLPRDVRPGDTVYSSSVNMNGVIKIRVSGTYAESTVARILELVENSSDKKAKAESFITKFARVYTPIVVFSALALAIIPPLLIGITDLRVWADWIARALVFLVVSCPCALVVSVPLSFFGAIGGASRSGILIKGANYIETLASVRNVVFDKTGTLTEGVFTVTEVSPEKGSADELLALCAAVEGISTHPIAEAIVKAHGQKCPQVADGRLINGEGVEGTVNHRRICVGNERMMHRLGIAVPRGEGKNRVHVSSDGEYLGSITLSDRLKPDAPAAMAELKRMGVHKILMLSGDTEENASAVASQLKLDGFRASLLPEDKVRIVEDCLSDGKTAFVGDGINDAPVLAISDVGIAMGGLGSDAAIEAADIVLMKDDVSDIPRAITLARRTMAIVRQNIAFSLAVKGAILILSAFGLANMWLAVFADVGVMVIATVNATRTLRILK